MHPLSILRLQKHKNTKAGVCPPIFQPPLITPPRYSCPDVPKPPLECPILPFGVSHFTIWGIPFCHLGCPILPFGVSHFAFWDIFSAHLCTMYSPDARFAIFVYSLQSLYVFFRFIMFLRNSFGWIKYIL